MFGFAPLALMPKYVGEIRALLLAALMGTPEGEERTRKARIKHSTHSDTHSTPGVIRPAGAN